MNRFLEELPTLIVTVVLVALIGVLLALHIVTIDSPLVGIIAAVIVPFWFLNAAFKWQAPGTVVTSSPAPQPTPVAPHFTTMVPQPPAHIQPIPQQFQQYGSTLPYPSVPGQ